MDLPGSGDGPRPPDALHAAEQEGADGRGEGYGVRPLPVAPESGASRLYRLPQGRRDGALRQPAPPRGRVRLPRLRLPPRRAGNRATKAQQMAGEGRAAYGANAAFRGTPAAQMDVVAAESPSQSCCSCRRSAQLRMPLSRASKAIPSLASCRLRHSWPLIQRSEF